MTAQIEALTATVQQLITKKEEEKYPQPAQNRLTYDFPY